MANRIRGANGAKGNKELRTKSRWHAQVREATTIGCASSQNMHVSVSTGLVQQQSGEDWVRTK